MRVRLSPQANVDVSEKMAFLKANGLSRRPVLEALRDARRVLLTTPWQGPVALSVERGGVRRLFLRRISSFLYYEVHEAHDEVRVLRLLHTSLPPPKKL